MKEDLIKFPSDRDIEKYMKASRYKFNLLEVVDKMPITAKNDKQILLYKTVPKHKRAGCYYIVDTNGQIIGVIGVHILGESISLDAEILPDFRNGGVGVSAVNAIKKDIFESSDNRYSKICRVIIETIHAPAISVAKKCGFKSINDFLYVLTKFDYFEQKNQSNKTVNCDYVK